MFSLVARSSRLSSRRSLVRGVVEMAVLVAVGAICLNTWLVGGLVLPAAVQGGSMAPTLLGSHLRWTCTRCQGAFACDLESLPAAGRSAICPRCGQPNDMDRGVPRGGRRLLIDRSAFSIRAPRRWETVVLRSPDEPQRLCVKRVVGLPGEVVDLRDGDVIINGTVARKPATVQSALAVAVADEHLAPERWKPEHEGRWVRQSEGFLHSASSSGSIDWLVYHHAEPTAASGDGALPVLDGSAFDQSESRQLNPVADVVLRCEVFGTVTDTCYLRARSRGDDFRIALPLGQGAARLSHNGNRVRAGRVPGGHHQALPVELVVSDQRFELSVAGERVLRYDYEPTPAEDDRVRLEIGAGEGALGVRKLEVLRDVYYTQAPGGPTQYRLGPDEYFVLGDNSPHSVDSRQWASLGGVSAGLLVGSALTW